MQKTRGVNESSLCACGHLECLRRVRTAHETYERLVDRLEKTLSSEQLSEAGNQRALKQFHELGDTLKKGMAELEAFKAEYARSVAEYYKREIVNAAIRREQPLKHTTFEEVRKEDLSSKPVQQKKKKSKK